MSIQNLNSSEARPDAHNVETERALKLHDDLLAAKPEGARHDSDICPFCVEKASQTTASDPSGSGRPDVSKSETTSTEGGTNPTMSDISQEAHEALLQKAVSEAVKATEQALAKKTEELETASAKVKELTDEVASVKADNDRINKELDAAQVKLTSATEEVSSLKSEIAKVEEAAKTAEIASKRGEQVKNLKLFPEEYVGEQASKWAALDDTAWEERLDEWKKLKPSTESTDTQESASAMTGTSGELTKEKNSDSAADEKPKSRRAVLGLV